MKLHIIIFNFNNQEIEVDDYIESDYLFEEEIKEIKSLQHKKGFFSMIGVEVNGLKLDIKDSQRFARYIILKYFKGFDFAEREEYSVGFPDFVLKKDNEKIYLELKLNGDCLRMSQLEWFFKNKDKNIKLININYDGDPDLNIHNNSEI